MLRRNAARSATDSCSLLAPAFIDLRHAYTCARAPTAPPCIPRAAGNDTTIRWGRWHSRSAACRGPTDQRCGVECARTPGGVNVTFVQEDITRGQCSSSAGGADRQQATGGASAQRFRKNARVAVLASSGIGARKLVAWPAERPRSLKITDGVLATGGVQST